MTKWKLTKWEVDQMEIDEVGINLTVQTGLLLRGLVKFLPYDAYSPRYLLEYTLAASEKDGAF